MDGYLNNIKNGGILLNAQLSQRINVIRKRIQDIENDLQHHFYKIKQSIADKTQSIIVVNSVVFPLIIVLIWILIYNIRIRIGRKKIEDKYNGNK